MTVLTGTDAEYMAGLASKTDEDIAAMRDDEVKQMLMDLRGIAPHLMIAPSNETIARLAEDEAKVKLFDIRDHARRS